MEDPIENGVGVSNVLLDEESRMLVDEFNRVRRMLEHIAAMRASLSRVETLLVILVVQVSIAISVELCSHNTNLDRDPCSCRCSSSSASTSAAAGATTAEVKHHRTVGRM